MNWLDRFRRLSDAGVLGMNHRNAEYVLDLNPRRLFPLVDSKRRMHDLCQSIGVPTPALHAVLPAHSSMRHLERLLQERPDCVLKPDRGSGGRGIMVLTGREGDEFIRHNGERIDLAGVVEHVSSTISGMYSLGGQPDAALIQKRVRPHPVFETISYQGIPDVRVVLYRFEPAMAMLRLPSKESGGRANLHQGGLGAGVDLESGVTCRAVQRDRAVSRHPDTGRSVIGFQVPHWGQILEMSRRVAEAVGLGYVGVDVVVDADEGPLLLEANARPGLAIQIANGRGLLPRLMEIDQLLAERGHAVP
jgi:alpha-L-glutamate ligase-like protein